MQLLDIINSNEIKTSASKNLFFGPFKIESLKSESKTIKFFEELYSYPPKFKIIWDSLDELKEDAFYSSNYGTLEHNIPFMESSKLDGKTESSQEAIEKKYLFSDYLVGYFNKNRTAKFYKSSTTKKLRESVKNVPVYTILNGNAEIILAKQTNAYEATVTNNLVQKYMHTVCGNFDPRFEQNKPLGLLFMSREDAETYLKEIAKEDPNGTKLNGLSIHCVGLDYAYQLTHQHSSNVDFRFVPDLNEVKTLLNKYIGKSDMIVENDQQQLRFRTRTVDILPFFGGFGKHFSPFFSFLSKNEYFKGVPIYVVQISDNQPWYRSVMLDPYFNLIGMADIVWSRFIQYSDVLVGFGQNWIMQGSILNTSSSSKIDNYIFFNREHALAFCKKNRKKVCRYKGSRTSTFFNFEAIVRKPKIFVYNLEDFLEQWEDTLLINENYGHKEAYKNLFNAMHIYFVPSEPAPDVTSIVENQSATLKNPAGNFKQYINLKYKKLSSFFRILLGSY